MARKLKTANALRSIGVYNTHGLLSRFAEGKRAIAVVFRGAVTGRGGRCAHVQVWSPNFDTDPDAPWYNHKRKTFLLFQRDRKQTIRDACAWAKRNYGIKEWGVCPMDRNALIPLEARKLALEAARAAQRELEGE